MRFDWQNLQLPTATDFNISESSRDTSTKQRITDFQSWGIVNANAYPATADAIPVSPTKTLPPNLLNILEFPITFDMNLGRISVGETSSSTAGISGGVAYDLNGNRIYIDNDNTFDFSNDVTLGGTFFGKKSSGNINIPLSTTASSGGCNTVPSVFGTYYVWIEYLEVNDPAYPITLQNGVNKYPKLLDGYRIFLTTSPTDPQVRDGISIFLAKVVWAAVAGGQLTITTSETDEDGLNSISAIPATTGDPHRVYALVRQQNVEVLPVEADRTLAYDYGMRMTLKDHVNAVGGQVGGPTYNNPHGLTLADIPGGTDEPKATANQAIAFAKGIVDLNIPQNSPNAQSDALFFRIFNSGLTPDISSVDAASLANTGLPLSNSTQDAFLRITPLGDKQFVYLNGTKYTNIYPTLANSSLLGSAPNTDGWISFSGTDDTPGTYAIFVSGISLNGVDTLILRKIQVSNLTSGFSTPLPAIDDITPSDPASLGERLLLGYVYWGGTVAGPLSGLNFDYARNLAFPAAVDDQRSLGLVGPQQLSTELKANAETGGLSGQQVENLIGNSNFLFDKVASQFPGWKIVDSSFLPNANITRIERTFPGFSDLAQVISGKPSPGALTGLKLSPPAGSSIAGTTRLYADIIYLKGKTYYSLSFWYKTVFSHVWTSKVKIGINDNNSGSPNPQILTPISGSMLDLTIINDGTWHRTNVIVETVDSVLPANQYYLEIDIEAPQSGAVVNDSLLITNVQITEGEWVVGYTPSRAVPKGSIIMWDISTSCPPGFAEVEFMRGRFPIGVNPAGNASISTPGAASATGGSLNADQLGQHNHGFSNVTCAKTECPNPILLDSINNNFVPLPTTALIFCRAI